MSPFRASLQSKGFSIIEQCACNAPLLLSGSVMRLPFQVLSRLSKLLFLLLFRRSHCFSLTRLIYCALISSIVAVHYSYTLISVLWLMALAKFNSPTPTYFFCAGSGCVQYQSCCAKPTLSLEERVAHTLTHTHTHFTCLKVTF